MCIRDRPNVSFRIKYENSVRAKETTITRLRLGTCCTNEYLEKINVIRSNKCHVCEDCIETIGLDHFLLRCPKSSLCNKVWDACQRLNICPQVEYVLNNYEILDVIYRNIKRKI